MSSGEQELTPKCFGQLRMKGILGIPLGVEKLALKADRARTKKPSSGKRRALAISANYGERGSGPGERRRLELFQQDHLLGLNEISGLQAAEVQPG
jgi:hypothetical protein